MVSNFYNDLAKGHIAEEIVKNVFENLTSEYSFELVNLERQYFHKGDIKAIGKDGRVRFLEVKNDTRIADTQNVLCEEEVYFKKHDCYQDGFMYNDYEIFCIVSQSERKIYVIDFEILKKIYRKGEFKTIHHPEQYSDCYLVPLSLIKKCGGLIAAIDY